MKTNEGTTKGSQAMNATDIIQQEREASAEFEAETIAAHVDGRDVTIAELRKTFDAVCDPTDWKAPWAAFVPAQIVGLVTAAVEFFHADRPVVDAPVEKLTHCVEGVFGATADENGVSLSAHNDPWNEWREITSSSQSRTQAYRLAAKVWDRVKECLTLSEAAEVLRAAGCKLHGYCAID